MDVLPTPDPGGEGTVAPEPSLAERLRAVERQLETLHQRLVQVEAALGPTVAQEVKGATSELARAITELGRRLALDLPHELRRHRDAIVSELRPPPPPPPAPSEVVPPPEVDGADEAEDGSHPDPDPDLPPDRRRTARWRRRHG